MYKRQVTTTELFNIINSRLLNQNNKITKTIISTNYDLKQLYNIYEERLLSRIIGNYNACYFFGDDIRIIKKISSKDVYKRQVAIVTGGASGIGLSIAEKLLKNNYQVIILSLIHI